MTFRVPTNKFSSDFTSRINQQRSTLSVLQERLATGKRINRPSDDPNGAEVVLNLRTTLKEIAQFGRNADAVNQKLTSADETLNGYETTLDRIKSLVSQGLNGTTTQTAKDAIAIEIESLRDRILNVANTQSNGEYLFGGTRQSEPPFDPATATQSAIPATSRYIQIEPGANAIAAGVTAETIFADPTSDIFADLNAAVAALRGTGDEVADNATLQNTVDRLKVYSDLAKNARTIIGVNMNSTELTQERLSNDSLSFQQRISAIEDADFAQTATDYAEAQNALEATLQVAGRGQRTLIDYLG